MRATAIKLAATGAILAVLTVPGAPAMASAHPSAAARTLKQIAALKKTNAAVVSELVALRARAAELEAREPPVPLPGGPAGGDLVGSYPNPTVKANAVSSTNLLDGTLQGADLGAGSIGAAQIADATLGSAAIADRTIGLSKLAGGSVGGSQLGLIHAAPSPPQTVLGPGQTAVRIAICPSGEALIGGGAEWEPNSVAGLTTTTSAPFPSPLGEGTAWLVEGRNDSSRLAGLEAIAFCLEAGS